jgi:hypothetical protein
MRRSPFELIEWLFKKDFAEIDGSRDRGWWIVAKTLLVAAGSIVLALWVLEGISPLEVFD